MSDMRIELGDEDILRYEESAIYEEKIRRLEDSVSSLRLSRRVLMSLLEQSQSQKDAEMERLLRENRRLRRRLAGCVGRMWENNSRKESGD